MSEAQRYEQWAANLDELATVPTEVLAHWVTAQDRCLWELTFGEPSDQTSQHDPDRELALNTGDRRALHKFWLSRRREDIEGLPDEDGGQR
jgi:hypothetical protein